jgi:hypothetical protein
LEILIRKGPKRLCNGTGKNIKMLITGKIQTNIKKYNSAYTRSLKEHMPNCIFCIFAPAFSEALQA